ncbi:MAG TPA: phosphatidylglycerophosphatase A [Vicinamibacterales bacterium]|nr:phosphatidylglycerophosphatase A [Vicinamibacterales bacterium]
MPSERLSARLALAVATVLGVGYAPIAPGTFGSLAGLLLWWAAPDDAVSQIVLIAAVSLAGVWSASSAERQFHATDPGPVVVDEVAGMLVTLYMIPVGWRGAIAGFLLFRAADIIKPFPARRLEALHGGLGIMADDVMAAIYANVALRLALAAVS